MPIMQVGGQWDISQGNGFRVNMNVTQTGDRLNAQATQMGHGVTSITAEGSVRGNHFDMVIDWTNGTKGHYTGDFKQGFFGGPNQGHLEGRTVDLNNLGSSASWQSEGLVVRFA
jgi:hypothetical protein